MPAAPTAGEQGQAPGTPAPQDGTTGQPQDGAAGGQSGNAPAPIEHDPRVLQAELSRAREEAAAARVELKALRDAEKARADAELTETQRMTKRQRELEEEVERLQKQAREAAITAAIAKTAVALGVIDPDAAVKLLDTDALDIDDKTGEPKNIEEALRALIKAKPYLVAKQESPTPGAMNAGAGANNAPPPNLTAEELAQATASGMTPERYAALKNVKTFEDWKKLQPAKT